MPRRVTRYEWGTLPTAGPPAMMAEYGRLRAAHARAEEALQQSEEHVPMQKERERLAEALRDANAALERQVDERTRGSDWPLMITDGMTEQYACRRISDHMNRLHHLLDSVEARQVDAEMLAAMAYLDTLFPHVDTGCFAS